MKAFATTAILLTVTTVFASTFSGTLNAPPAGQATTLAWSGGPLTGTNGVGGVITECTSATCDAYNLTVNVASAFYSSNPNYAVHVAINWGSNLKRSGHLHNGRQRKRRLFFDAGKYEF